MLLDELELFWADVHRVRLDGIWILISRGAVNRGNKLRRQCAIVTDYLQRSDQLQPIPVGLSEQYST